MKLTVSIAGQRAGEDIEVPVQVEGDSVTFSIPNVGRKSSAEFSVKVADLEEAIRVQEVQRVASQGEGGSAKPPSSVKA